MSGFSRTSFQTGGSQEQDVDKTDYSVLAGQYAAHRRIHPRVVALLASGLRPESRVLEIGCGTGNYLAALHDSIGCECVGLDPSPEMLSQLRMRDLPIRAIEGRAEQMELLEGEFDLVYSVDVIHHVDDRDAAFREAYRRVRNGGRLCTVTDSEWTIRNREPQSMYFPDTIDVELRRYPSIEVLRLELTRAGFGSLDEQTVEHSYEITDAVAYRHKVFSSLLYISDESFRRGLARLEDALRRGPISCVSRYVLVWATKQEAAVPGGSSKTVTGGQAAR